MGADLLLAGNARRALFKQYCLARVKLWFEATEIQITSRPVLIYAFAQRLTFDRRRAAFGNHQADSAAVMKKSTKTGIVFIIIFLELAWMLWPRLYMHGSILDEPYRNAERKAVLYAWREHPTPKTEAAFAAEVKLLDRHSEMPLIALLVVNAAGIYLFWRYTPTKTA